MMLEPGAGTDVESGDTGTLQIVNCSNGPSKTESPRTYGINDLPEEIQGKIFNYFEQTEVPKLALVCKQWKRAIDEYYVFQEWTLGHHSYFKVEDLSKLRVYYADKNYEQNRVFETFTKRCIKCNILSQTFPTTFDPNFQFMKYPTYLKELGIFAPIDPQYLQHIISSSINLEKFEFSHFSDFPTILTLAQTPGLAQLKNLKEISCKSGQNLEDEQQIFTNVKTFMDCTFQKLERFSLVLEDRKIPPALFWKFLIVHSSTLRYLWLQDTCCEAATNSELEEFGASPLPNLIEMEIFIGLWSPFWATILSQQSKLQTLIFTFAEYGYDLIGAPWFDFQTPIMNSSSTLTRVKLAGLTLKAGGRSRPLNLSVFKSCGQLTNLYLESTFDDDGHTVEEMLPMINGIDLPTSLVNLCFNRIPMLSSDLMLTLERLTNLENLELYFVGQDENLGVTSPVINVMRVLENLKGLSIIGLNTIDPEENEKLQTLIETLGKEFDGSDTWLELEDAHNQLSVLQQA